MREVHPVADYWQLAHTDHQVVVLIHQGFPFVQRSRLYAGLASKPPHSRRLGFTQSGGRDTYSATADTNRVQPPLTGEGKLKGKQPKFFARQQAHLAELHQAGKHTIVELAELFSVSRPTVYRVLDRARTVTRSSGPVRDS